jgi:hypothetical protein
MNDMWWDVAGVDKLAGPIELACLENPDFLGTIVILQHCKPLETHAFNLALHRPSERMSMCVQDIRRGLVPSAARRLASSMRALGVEIFDPAPMRDRWPRSM